MRRILLAALGVALLVVLPASFAEQAEGQTEARAEARKSAEPVAETAAEAAPAAEAAEPTAKGHSSLGYCRWSCWGPGSPPTSYSAYTTYQDCCGGDPQSFCPPGQNAIGRSFDGQKCGS